MSTSEPNEESFERPDGGVPMALGWLSLIVAIVLLVMAMQSRPSASDELLASVGGGLAAKYASEIAEAYAQQFLLNVGAAAFFSLFLILWSVGYIVRAISFLPGAPNEEKSVVTE